MVRQTDVICLGMPPGFTLTGALILLILHFLTNFFQHFSKPWMLLVSSALSFSSLPMAGRVSTNCKIQNSGNFPVVFPGQIGLKRHSSTELACGVESKDLPVNIFICTKTGSSIFPQFCKDFFYSKFNAFSSLFQIRK